VGEWGALLFLKDRSFSAVYCVELQMLDMNGNHLINLVLKAIKELLYRGKV